LEELAFHNGSPDLPMTGIFIPLFQGSLLKIYSRMVERAEAVQLIEQEIVNRPHLFCPHKVQGFNNEQWVQKQFHDKATDDFKAAQPGYQYNNQITLKARTVSSAPS
jgi:hypothetical protein